MVDDHDMRVDCARLFEEVKAGVRAAKDSTDRLAATFHEVRGEQRHERIALAAQLSELTSTSRERLAVVENSARAAHHRLDSHNKLIWGIVAVFLAAAIGILIKIAVGGL